MAKMHLKAFFYFNQIQPKQNIYLSEFDNRTK